MNRDTTFYLFIIFLIYIISSWKTVHYFKLEKS